MGFGGWIHFWRGPHHCIQQGLMNIGQHCASKRENWVAPRLCMKKVTSQKRHTPSSRPAGFEISPFGCWPCLRRGFLVECEGKCREACFQASSSVTCWANVRSDFPLAYNKLNFQRRGQAVATETMSTVCLDIPMLAFLEEVPDT